MRLGMAVAAIAMAASAGAWAEAPAAAPQQPAASVAASAQWDDSHMRSRYQETPRAKRPLITGESGYGALASGSAQAATAVSPKLEYTTQRQWTQGVIGTSTQPAPSSQLNSDSSGISRGSSIRAGATSSRSRGR